jgi:hypothetical protein
LDPSTQEYFQNRTAAVKQAYAKFDEKKKAEVQRLVDEYKRKGNAPEVKQK